MQDYLSPVQNDSAFGILLKPDKPASYKKCHLNNSVLRVFHGRLVIVRCFPSMETKAEFSRLFKGILPSLKLH